MVSQDCGRLVGPTLSPKQAGRRPQPAARDPQRTDAGVARPPTTPPPATELALLLLAWFASQNRSLYAARCLVECVVARYLRGDTFNELQMSISLGALGASAAGGALSRSLLPADQAALQSWLALIMLTLHEVGTQRGAAPTTDCNAGSDPQQTPSGGSSSSGSSSASSSATAEQMRSGGISPPGRPQPSASTSGTCAADSSSGTGGSSASGGPSAPAPLLSDDAPESLRQYLQGMRVYVKQTVAMYDQGYTLERLQRLQSMMDSQKEEPPSQFKKMMQQYTRLVILTLEVVAVQRLACGRPLDNPTSIPAASTGYAGSIDLGLPGSSSSPTPSGRGLALQLLLAFMGAALGSRFSQDCFVQVAYRAYSQGLPAAHLVHELQEADFEQTGGLVPVGLPVPGVAPTINRQLFARWVSIAYMSWAHLGVPFPGADTQEGWAWAGAAAAANDVPLPAPTQAGEAAGPVDASAAPAMSTAAVDEALEAVGLDAFVQNALKRAAGAAAARASAASSAARDVAGSELEPGSAASAAGSLPRSDAQDTADVQDEYLQRLQEDPQVAELIQQDRRQLSEVYRERGTLRGREVPPMVRMEDTAPPETSAVYRVFGQQVELVARCLELHTRMASADDQ